MIQIGIIGAGRIGRIHGESILYHVKNGNVAAMADSAWSNEARAWAESHHISCRDDYRSILEDPAIDAVLICTPTPTHAPISLEAIRAGKHIFCEKPVSQDVDEIRKVQKALEGSSLKYQVGFNRRFDHNFQALREAVSVGQVGDLHMVKITSRDPEAPPIEYVKTSGGMFLDMTIHDFDMVRYLSGCDVEEIYANAAVLVDPDIGRAGDVDTAILTMRLTNGALAVIDNSRQAAYGYDQRAEVFGSGGQAAISNDAASTTIISRADGIYSEKPLYFFLERYMASFTKEISQFIQAIESDGPVPVSINDGLQAVVMGIAAGQSVREKRPVAIREILGNLS